MEPEERQLFYPCRTLGKLLEPFRQLADSKVPEDSVPVAAEVAAESFIKDALESREPTQLSPLQLEVQYSKF